VRSARDHLAGADGFPEHRQRVKPGAAEPGTIGARASFGAEHREMALCRRLVRHRRLGKHKPARHRLHRSAALVTGLQEMDGVEAQYARGRPAAAVAEPIFERGDRQARVICLTRRERAPAGQFDFDRH